LTRGDPLDFFILFSSAAGLLGAPGQANYAAANAALDALAHYRRSIGLPALSIDWGPWAEVGLAAAQANRGQRLALRGVPSLAPAQGLDILGRLLGSDAVQCGVLTFNLRHWRQFYPKVAASPLFGLLPDEASPAVPAGAHAMRAALQAAAPAERRGVMEAHLSDVLSQVLRIERDQIDPQRPLSSIGFDSLMALEYRNRLEASLGLTLPATLVWGHPTIAALAPHLAERMGLPFEAPAANPAPAAPAADLQLLAAAGDDWLLSQKLTEVASLSDDDALRALQLGHELRGGPG
jgi:acyl carrier protein